MGNRTTRDAVNSRKDKRTVKPRITCPPDARAQADADGTARLQVFVELEQGIRRSA